MFRKILNTLYPQYCTLCHRHGSYLCDSCRKGFKMNLPECYVCRRLSPGYATHFECKTFCSLDRIFVGWEYNNRSSQILKMYKYRNVQDVSNILSKLLIERLLNCGYNKYMHETLLIPVPISGVRFLERGFNQTGLIAQNLSKQFACDLDTNLVYCKNTKYHRARQSKQERKRDSTNPFFIHSARDISSYKSITIVDDVITTGRTLEDMTKVIRKTYPTTLELNAICLFRGKPYYL